MEIIIDTREQKPWGFSSYSNIVTTSRKLDNGDYSIIGL